MPIAPTTYLYEQLLVSARLYLREYIQQSKSKCFCYYELATAFAFLAANSSRQLAVYWKACFGVMSGFVYQCSYSENFVLCIFANQFRDILSHTISFNISLQCLCIYRSFKIPRSRQKLSNGSRSLLLQKSGLFYEVYQTKRSWVKLTAHCGATPMKGQ